MFNSFTGKRIINNRKTYKLYYRQLIPVRRVVTVPAAYNKKGEKIRESFEMVRVSYKTIIHHRERRG